MEKVRFFILLTWLMLFISESYGQEPFGDKAEQIFFKKIGIKDGLSQASVNCFLEDHIGFMWIGTDDGLNRYDGVNFKIYTSGAAKEGKLSNANINFLLEQPKGTLWVGTTSGLNKLSLSTEEVTQYTDTTINYHFTDINIDSLNQRMWLAANEGGLKYLDFHDEKIRNFEHPWLVQAIVYHFTPLNNTQFLISTLRGGIFLFDKEKLRIEVFLNDTTAGFRLPGNKVRKILKDGNTLIIGIEGAGVAYYDLGTGDHFVLNSHNSGLSSDMVYSLEMDDKGNLFVGTDQGGLNVIGKDGHSIKVYKKDEFDDRSISSNVIRSIYTDSKSNIWLGTYYEGINFINKSSRGIYYFGRHSFDPHSLSHNHVTAFSHARAGGMWVGTDGGGLNYFKDGRFTVIKKGNTIHDLNDNVVMCLDESPDGVLFIGTYRGGLNVLKDGIIKKYTYNEKKPYSISNNAVWAIQKDINSGNYWLATNNGLNKFDVSTGKFTVYKPKSDERYLNTRNFLRALCIDHAGNLWVGTYGGLGKFNLKTKTFEFFISKNGKNSRLSGDVILNIHEDKKHFLWLGTFGNGLNKYNPQTGEVKVYDESYGLPSNIIQSIEIDSKGYLWISTMKGLVRFDPENETTEILDESFGLQSTVFKLNASYKSDEGYLYFGGTKGFNVFHPDSIVFPTISDQIIFTDFHVYDKSLKTGIIHGDCGKNTSIDLTYDQSRYFTVYFSVPDFVIAHKINFKYQLAGFDEGWHYIGNDRKITFTGLGPGDYELRIKASSSNVWPDTYTFLPISIIPPFYRRKPVIAISGLLLIFLVSGFYRYRTKMYKRKQMELEKLVEAKNKEIKKQNKELIKRNLELEKTHDLLRGANESLEDEVKKRTRKLKATVNKLNKTVQELDRFVYSASHDLSAPLKSIKGLVYIAKFENKNDNLDLHLNYIEESILKLETVISDLIQFSRNSRLAVKLSDIPLLNFVNEILISYRYLPEYKRIDIKVNIPADVVVKSDQQRLQMILYNIIGNAIKYQDTEKTNPWIKINYLNLGQHWGIEVVDNGIGISSEHKTRIFNMFYRATETSSGTGLGLFIVKEAVEKLSGTINFQSKEGEGSTFRVEFRK